MLVESVLGVDFRVFDGPRAEAEIRSKLQTHQGLFTEDSKNVINPKRWQWQELVETWKKQRREH